jgi:hypothetical protein
MCIHGMACRTYEINIMNWACISYNKTAVLLYVLLLWRMESRMSILFVISGNLIHIFRIICHNILGF